MTALQTKIQESRNLIDDYLNTVYAIVGFLNTYKYEVKNLNEEIILFQGRKLYTKDAEQFLTPDLGIVISGNSGLIGEVKYSFPLDKKLWNNTFQQIKKYEEITSGWPTDTMGVDDFDIVLLVHQSRSRAVVDYYLNNLTPTERVNKVFAIIEFNRSSQSKEFFNFRIEHGNLSNKTVNEKLYEGLYVPLEVYVKLYSKIKIYDVEPPLPHLLHMIYECIIDKLVGQDHFKKITPKTKQSVVINSLELTERLRDVYSFKTFYSEKYLSGQPEFPKIEWVKNALTKLSEIGEGFWLDKSAGQFSYLLTHKEDDILSHYIKKTIGTATQPELFE